ncbi:hypothetical protein L6164_012826 [Bauhinia variegata]|uniref:Uncharacterized protein n=1 Tax=Bauhinia variegata TaxID=167791 RepID=A0ACB9PAQ1_BAUVA|nr:hypothetical protein L6164_012826 [Bauhinia variegata]
MEGLIKALSPHHRHHRHHHHGDDDDDKEHNPLTMSDEQILEQIVSTHVHTDTKLDVESLFILVENILKRSTIIVDNVLQGNQTSLEHIDDKFPPASFCSPLCTLKQIAHEMSCKPPGEEIAHKTTLSILHNLSNYSWETKAVLTLAAFALECGDFWLLSQLQPTDPLAKSVAILKRVPALTKPEAVRKHRPAIAEVNNLIKACFQVLETIFELERICKYDTKDVPALAPAIEQKPIFVYWAIIAVVAIVTQVDCLITESESRQELSHFGQRINVIHSKLRKQVSLCWLQIEDVEYYKRVKNVFQIPTEIVEVFKVLFFWKDAPIKPIYDGSTKTLVEIDVLRKKNVLLFISTLEITEEEINILKPVHESEKCADQYKIVWVPFVEEWTDKLREKFEELKSKMNWFVVHHFAGIIKGFKFIKEEWQFKKKPMVVHVNPQGKVLHQNAFHLIQVWGLEAFPFTLESEESLHQEASWVGSLAKDINPKINNWIKEEKYIFFYGGNDKGWIQEFTKYATALANDATIKEANISIELFCVEHEHKNIISRFWNSIESLFVTKMHKASNAVSQEVHKMLSYKHETGWALLSKGSTVIFSGHGTTILKSVIEFEKWKQFVISKGFEISLREHHEKIVRATHRCSHIEIHNVAGKIPDTIKCPECHRVMEVLISYKCCHDDAGRPANNGA